jgi:hypothetical protein
MCERLKLRVGLAEKFHRDSCEAVAEQEDPADQSGPLHRYGAVVADARGRVGAYTLRDLDAAASQPDKTRSVRAVETSFAILSR